MKLSIVKCKNSMGSNKPSEEGEKPSEDKVQEGWRMDVNGEMVEQTTKMGVGCHAQGEEPPPSACIPLSGD